MWQQLYAELKDKNFMVVAVAEESRGAQTEEYDQGDHRFLVRWENGVRLMRRKILRG